MKIVHLFMAASMPVVKVFMLIGLGFFLALDQVQLLGLPARQNLNQIVFYVFNPALVGSSLAKTITFRRLLTLWFMPVNVLFTFIFGSAFGWMLVKITRPPKHLKGLIIGSCSAGNLGYMIIIIIPAICKEKGSPFGTADVCQQYGLSYSTLSLALGTVYLWVYVYNILRISSRETVERETDAELPAGEPDNDHESNINGNSSVHCSDPELPSIVPVSSSMKYCLTKFSKKINLKALLAPSTIGAIVGFVIGMSPRFKKLLIGNDAPLHVITDAASMLGDASIPAVILILGANLLEGLKGSSVHISIIISILVVRYIFLPLLGTLIVKGAIRYGLVSSDDLLYQFVLLLQYALPPAMNIATITQQFGAGQNECSVIMLWAYGLASISLTLWCTFFLWLVTS